ncbi:hypothetical protein VNI00_007308, partial [Paramarasmius palmivorus]
MVLVPESEIIKAGRKHRIAIESDSESESGSSDSFVVSRCSVPRRRSVDENRESTVRAPKRTAPSPEKLASKVRRVDSGEAESESDHDKDARLAGDVPLKWILLEPKHFRAKATPRKNSDSESEVDELQDDSQSESNEHSAEHGQSGETSTEGDGSDDSDADDTVKRCEWNIAPPGKPYKACDFEYLNIQTKKRQRYPLTLHISEAHYDAKQGTFACRWKGCTSRATGLKDHYRGGHGQKEYGCETCKKKYSRDDALKRHQKEVKHGKFGRARHDIPSSQQEFYGSDLTDVWARLGIVATLKEWRNAAP